MARRITVQVHADGTMAAETHGFSGATCLDEVSRIEELCGERAASSKLTEEYYKSEQAQEVAQTADVDLER
ncbi:MAG TPA: DUF2997 domain-containing protein [Microthrixaceae bacterium]|nr:DUF2997 domain-containing protein [Microthrixaceae bacterium]